MLAPIIFVVIMHALTSAIHMKDYRDRVGKQLLLDYYFFGTFFYPYNKGNSLLLDLDAADLRRLQFWGKCSGWAAVGFMLWLLLKLSLIII